MIITNKLNLPEPFNSLAKKDEKEFDNSRFSVTELLEPTREIILKRKYYHLLTEDVSDMIPALLGTAFHKMMEELTNDNETEVKYELKLGEYTLVGKIDKIDGDTICDYKTCKVSKITKKDFTNDRLQGLMYAYIRLMVTGVKTTKLKFYNLMKDWSKISYKSDYPLYPIYIWEYDIQDSDYDFIEKFIKNKLNDIKEGFNNLPACSDEEKWYTGTKYAVYKNVNDKRATYITDTETDAHNYITNKCGGAGEIKVRKGENLKCKYYCLCSKFCVGGEYKNGNINIRAVN